MAKVYDALKQVEAERSRQLKSATVGPRAERQEPNLWKRFSGRIAGRNGAAEAMSPEVAADETESMILSRLEACERLASMHLPELERQMRQEIQNRLDAVGREHAASLVLLSNQTRQEVAVLKRRVTLLFGAVLVLLGAIVLRH